MHDVTLQNTAIIHSCAMHRTTVAHIPFVFHFSWQYRQSTTTQQINIITGKSLPRGAIGNRGH